MAAQPRFLLVPLVILLAYTAVAMISALSWALIRFVKGRPILPPWPKSPRMVPWGVGSVVMVIVAWVVINLVVSSVYVHFRADHRIRAAALPLPSPALPGPPLKTTQPDRTKTAAPLLGFGDQIVMISVINVLLLVCVPPALRLATGADWEDLGISAGKPVRNLKLGAVAFLVVTPVVMAVNSLAQLGWKPNRHPLEKMLREESHPGVIVLAYLSAVVLAPAAEELIFRGMIQAWLRRAFHPDGASGPDSADDDFAEIPATQRRGRCRFAPKLPFRLRTRKAEPAEGYEPPGDDLHDQQGPGWAAAGPGLPRLMPILLTSVFFAAVHFEQMPAPLAILPLSVALGLLYETTGSLLPSFVLHALFNGFNTTLLLTALLATPRAAT